MMTRKISFFLVAGILLISSVVWSQPPTGEFNSLPNEEKLSGYLVAAYITFDGNPINTGWVGIFDLDGVCAGADPVGAFLANSFAVATYVDNPTDPGSDDGGIDCDPLSTFPSYSSCENFIVVYWNPDPTPNGSFYIYKELGVPKQYLYVDVSGGFGGSPNFVVDEFDAGLTLNFEGPPDLSTAFPIELLYFKGRLQSDITFLEWATAAEINNSHFEIQHSTDGTHFETIGRVEGAGNYHGLLKYDFTDENPNLGLNYYRLKQVDFDGEFEYSKVITIQLGRQAGSDLGIFPNPAASFTEVVLPEGMTEQPATITVHDLSGREVLRRIEQPTVSFRLELGDIPAGFYTISVRSGNETFTKPLVIQ